MQQFLDARSRLAARIEGRPSAVVSREQADASASAYGRLPAQRLAHSAGSLPERAAVWVVGIYFVLKMLYVFNVGTAQPSDMLMILLAILLVSPRYLIQFLAREVALTVLVVWVLAVNTTWYVVLGNTQFLVFCTYYLFNVIIAVSAFAAYRSDPRRFERVIPWFLYASIAIQTGFVLVSASGRASGSFLNPNQLAYWSVTVVSLLLVTRRSKVVLLDLPFILMATWCALESVSRAGLVSMALLAAIWAWAALATPLRRVIGGLCLILVMIAAVSGGAERSFFGQLSSVEAFEERQARKNQQSLSEERNLDRIVDYASYTIFGAGEGAYGRFEEGDGLAIEIHSSFVTILFSYGIIGLVAFAAMILGLFLRLPLALSIYQLPMLTYGFTHNGLRFSFFWIVMGLLFAMKMDAETAARPRARQKVRAAPEMRVFGQRGSSFLRRLSR